MEKGAGVMGKPKCKSLPVDPQWLCPRQPVYVFEKTEASSKRRLIGVKNSTRDAASEKRDRARICFDSSLPVPPLLLSRRHSARARATGESLPARRRRFAMGDVFERQSCRQVAGDGERRSLHRGPRPHEQ